MSQVVTRLLAVFVLAGQPLPPLPETPKQPVTTTYHGVEVTDHYRWLEKADDPAVRKWVEAQDRHARATLGKNLYEVIRLLAPRHADNARVFVGPSDAFSIPVSALQDAPRLDFSPGEAPPAESRAQACALIEGVAAHRRSGEPSNPAPYLLERARALATRDFLSLLGEVFPSDDLSSMKAGN